MPARPRDAAPAPLDPAPEEPATRARRQPVQERSSETFKRIEDAAARLLGRGVSLNEMTTLQIAREAGVSVGGLYRFFPDKQSIVDAIAMRRLGDFEDAVSADILGRPPFRDAGALVSHIIDVFVAYLDVHPDFRTIVYGGGHLSHDIRQRHFGHDARSAQFARRYAADILGVPDSPELALRWRMVGEISGPLIGLALDQPTLAERDRVLEESKRMITAHLFGQPGP